LTYLSNGLGQHTVLLFSLKKFQKAEKNFQNFKILGDNEFFSAGLVAFISGWGITNVTRRIISAKLKTLKVEVIDKNFCRRRIYGIKHFHICAASIHRALNEAVCDVSNV